MKSNTLDMLILIKKNFLLYIFVSFTWRHIALEEWFIIRVGGANLGHITIHGWSRLKVV